MLKEINVIHVTPDQYDKLFRLIKKLFKRLANGQKLFVATETTMKGALLIEKRTHMDVPYGNGHAARAHFHTSDKAAPKRLQSISFQLFDRSTAYELAKLILAECVKAGIEGVIVDGYGSQGSALRGRLIDRYSVLGKNGQAAGYVAPSVMLEVLEKFEPLVSRIQENTAAIQEFFIEAQSLLPDDESIATHQISRNSMLAYEIAACLAEGILIPSFQTVNKATS